MLKVAAASMLMACVLCDSSCDDWLEYCVC